MGKSLEANKEYSVVTVAATMLRGASLAQLAEHALRKRTVVGSIPTGGFSQRFANKGPLRGSNPRPYAYEAHALPTELRRRCERTEEGPTIAGAHLLLLWQANAK